MDPIFTSVLTVDRLDIGEGPWDHTRVAGQVMVTALMQAFFLLAIDEVLGGHDVTLAGRTEHRRQVRCRQQDDWPEFDHPHARGLAPFGHPPGTWPVSASAHEEAADIRVLDPAKPGRSSSWARDWPHPIS